MHFISYFSTIDNFVPPTIPNGKSYCPAYNDLIGDGFIFSVTELSEMCEASSTVRLIIVPDNQTCPF